jgi:hypothetical protein
MPVLRQHARGWDDLSGAGENIEEKLIEGRLMNPAGERQPVGNLGPQTWGTSDVHGLIARGGAMRFRKMALIEEDICWSEIA